MYRLATTALACVVAGSAIAQRPDSLTASGVYRRYADEVVRVQVVEQSSSAKAGVGSGFFVTATGGIVTNYHVIAPLVTDPDRYRAEITDTHGHTLRLSLLAIDVVHDLAVLTSTARPAAFFALTPTTVTNGTHLYSLGHPLDLDLSVVEGTYNGLLDYALYPKIHFTGAINPGMSGGPALTATGAVVGINVSTEGEEVAFLVPADRARELVSRAFAPGYVQPHAFLPVVAAQLREYQDTYLPQLFADSTPVIALGPYTLPTRPRSFFRCWADATEERTAMFRRTDHRCSTEDDVFISEDQSSGEISMHHELLTSTELGRVRFAHLYATHLATRTKDGSGSEDDVTSYRCETHNVRSNGLTLRAALCVRAYRKLDGLYDAKFVVATLGAPTTGLISDLTMTGVTFDNAQSAARRFLHLIRWAR